jgi:hypothetical protein
MLSSQPLRRLWLPCLAAIPIATFLVLGLFTSPTADDFCNADRLARLGYSASIKSYYLEWTGRYASASIALLSGYLGQSTFMTWYWLWPISLIVVTLASTYVLLQTINGAVLDSGLRRSDVVTAAIVLTSTYLLGVEQPNEIIYWFTASTGYQLSNILFVLLLATLIRLCVADGGLARGVWFVTAGVLACIIVGQNEMALVLTVGVLGLFALSVFVASTSTGSRATAALLGCLCCIGIAASLVAVLAPGNYVRAEYETKYWGMHRASSFLELIEAGGSAPVWAAVTSVRWLIAQPAYVLAAFLALSASRKLSIRVQERLDRAVWLWLPLIAFALTAATALPGFLLGKPPPARATANIYVVFWLSVVATGVLLMRRFGWQLQGRGVTTVLTIGLLSSLLLHPRHVLAMQEFKDAVLYRLQLQERDQMANDAVRQGRRDLVVPKLGRIPTLIHVRDLSEDLHHYYNGCYASYKHLDSVVAQGDADTARIVRTLRATFTAQLKRLMPWRQ